MFKMRREQKDAFARDAIADFEARAGAHLGKHFPVICRTVGERVVLRLVRHAIVRAPAYGIDTERGVATWAHVMLLHGRDFDVDPACEWAREILAAPVDPGERGDLLLAAAFTHLDGEPTA